MLASEHVPMEIDSLWHVYVKNSISYFVNQAIFNKLIISISHTRALFSSTAPQDKKYFNSAKYMLINCIEKKKNNFYLRKYLT